MFQIEKYQSDSLFQTLYKIDFWFTQKFLIAVLDQRQGSPIRSFCEDSRHLRQRQSQIFHFKLQGFGKISALKEISNKQFWMFIVLLAAQLFADDICSSVLQMALNLTTLQHLIFPRQSCGAYMWLCSFVSEMVTLLFMNRVRGYQGKKGCAASTIIFHFSKTRVYFQNRS